MKPLETTDSADTPERFGEIRCSDDIVRELADRRFESAFGSQVSPEAKDSIRENPDQIESPEDFDKSARQAGISNPETVLGFMDRADQPAHIKDGPVAVEIATKVHEDIHRATHPESLREMSNSSELQGIYEGLTEYLTQKGVEGLHRNVADCYQTELGEAEKLAAEVGDEKLLGYLFRHERSDEIDKAIERLS